MEFNERIMAQAPARLIKKFKGRSPLEVYDEILYHSDITDDEFVAMIDDGVYGGTLQGFRDYYNRITQKLWKYDMYDKDYSILADMRARAQRR